MQDRLSAFPCVSFFALLARLSFMDFLRHSYSGKINLIPAPVSLKKYGTQISHAIFTRPDNSLHLDGIGIFTLRFFFSFVRSFICLCDALEHSLKMKLDLLFIY